MADTGSGKAGPVITVKERKRNLFCEKIGVVCTSYKASFRQLFFGFQGTEKKHIAYVGFYSPFATISL